MGIHISLAAEKIGSLVGLPITNSLLATWLTMAVLFIFTFLATRKISKVPSHIQSIAELVVGGLYDFFGQVAGHNIKRFFPLVASLFLFIILANWIGLLPGFGTIGYSRMEKHETEEVAVAPAAATTTHEEVATPSDGHEEEATTPAQEQTATHAATAENAASHEKEEMVFVPLLRAATADLNMTIGLALIVVLAIQYYGFAVVGFHYTKRFFDFSNPIMFVVGLLEIVSEVSKVISFAFRLFGNIFAGEVLLAVMAFLMPFLLPLPFLMMELFVGFIQAVVFSMLTAVFLNIAVSHGEEQHAAKA